MGLQADPAAFPAQAPIPPYLPASGKAPGVAQKHSSSSLLQNLQEEAVLASARWSQPALSSHALKVRLGEHTGLPGRFSLQEGIIESQRVWVGRDLKAHLIPPPCHG